LGKLKLYVSKGIGTSLIPFRFFARAEASVFYI
jgi:predicted MPP superfamily phosphohydrolase